MVDSERIVVSEEQVLVARRGYYGAISLVDDHVGRILAAVPEDSVVVFTSDHGDMLGERGLWYKMAPFEQSIRVPLIIHAPQRFAPRRVAQPVSLLDLTPTLVELGGGTLDSSIDGVSVLGDPPERDIPLEYLAEGVRSPQVTLVRGNRKLVRTLGEPDLVYNERDEPVAGDHSLASAADGRWDLEALDRYVRASQRRRRVVGVALATGRITKWDHPEGDGRYIDTGDDFWSTLERARRP